MLPKTAASPLVATHATGSCLNGAWCEYEPVGGAAGQAQCCCCIPLHMCPVVCALFQGVQHTSWPPPQTFHADLPATAALMHRDRTCPHKLVVLGATAPLRGALCLACHANTEPTAAVSVQVRQGLAISEGSRVCVFMFGAHALTLEPQEDWLPPGWVCVVCSGGKPLSAHPPPPRPTAPPGVALINPVATL